MASGHLAEVDEEAHNTDIDGPGSEADQDNTKSIGAELEDEEIEPIVDDMRRLSLIRNVKLTQIQMMIDRGYELPEFDVKLKEVSKTPALFWEYMNEQAPLTKKSSTVFWDALSHIYLRKDNQRIKNLVLFLPPPMRKAFPTARLNKMIALVKRDSTIRFIDIIYEYPLTKITKTKLALTNRVNYSWTYSDMVSPLIRNYYVRGNYKLISPQRFNELYKDPIAAKAGLPAICRDDPLVKYYQWLPEMVVENITIGDVNVAVGRVLKHYVVTYDSIAAPIIMADIPTAPNSTTS